MRGVPSVIRTRSGVPSPTWTALALGLIAVAIVAAYHNGLTPPFEFDDVPSIRGNPSLHRLWPLWVPLSPPPGSTLSGRPIANLTFALNYALSGTGVTGYHATNILIHILSAWALFGVARRTLIRPVLSDAFGRDALPLALGIALIWAVHPVGSESVTYVIQRVESLMALFYLLTLYCFVRSLEGSCRAAWASGAVCACLLGMATKEVMATAPLLVLLYDRTFVAGTFARALSERRRLYVALACTWGLLAYLVMRTGWSRGGTAGLGEGTGLATYWLAQSGAIARYLWITVWPRSLVFDYGTAALRHPTESMLCTLLVLPIAAATVIALIRRPALGFLGAWFFLILAPTSLVPVVTQTMAEHRMYLPMVAIVGLAVLGGYVAFGRRVFIAVALAALGLGFLTIERNRDYRSEVSLWRDTVAKEPENARAHCSLAVGLLDTPGGEPEAITELEKALALEPRYPLAQNELGIALKNVPGRMGDAVQHLRVAIGLDPGYALAHYNLGVILAESGQVTDALGELETAVRLDPSNPDAHNNLGVALCVSGRVPEGIEQMRSAISLKPGNATAHFDLGCALNQSGNPSEAIAQFQEALAQKNDYLDAHYNLGLALWKSGRPKEGAEHLREAIRINPQDPRAHAALGGMLFESGQLRDSAAEFEWVLRISPGNSAAVGMLERLRRAGLQQ